MQYEEGCIIRQENNISKERSIPKIEYLLLGIIFLAYFLLQLPRLSNAAWEVFESWRQSDTYSIAVNYLQYNMDPLAPQFNYDGSSDIYVQLELQIVPYASALCFKLLGFASPIIPRMISLLLYFGSALFLYKIIRKFTNIWPALASVLLYLFMPISLLYSRAIMPEACACFFYCGAVFFLLKWYIDGDQKAIWISAFFTAFAIMEKLPTAFVGLLIIAAFIWRLKSKCLASKEFYGYGIISLGLPAIYYVYASSRATAKFVNGIASKHIFTDEILDIFSKDAQSFFRTNLPLFFGIAILTGAFFGLFLCFTEYRKPLVVWTFAFIAEFATIVAVIKFGYYMIFMAPILAGLCGILLEEMFKWKKQLSIICFLLIFLFTLRSGITLWSEKVRENTGITNVASCIDRVTEKTDVIAVSSISPAYLNAANRHGYRANLKYYDYIPEGAKYETDYFIQNNVSYFVVPFNSVYNDSTGEYLDYLNATFPVVLQNEYCTIFRLNK